MFESGLNSKYQLELMNAMEYIVIDTLGVFLTNYHLHCQCEQCKLDIIALTLNRIPPRYVSSQKGEVYIKSLYMNEQLRLDVLRELTKAAMIVEQNPHRD